MIATPPIQFGWDLPPAPSEVVPILKGELRVINTDPHNQKEKRLVRIPTPQGETMWVYPDIIESQQWMTVTNRKSKGKAKASSSNVMGIFEKLKMSSPLLVQETRSPPLLPIQAHFPHQRLSPANHT